MFEHGLERMRADFHLHTKKDKEFKYAGEETSFINDYISALSAKQISIGVITNHNKFDEGEYKALRKAGKKQNIFILPGVELTVKEGANGVHALIVFNPDEWLREGNNHIATFLATAFAAIPNPENRNTKSILDLKSVFEVLDRYGMDYFVIFAHVDQNSGLFSECKGGMLETLVSFPSFKEHVLGLQKSTSESNYKMFSQYLGYEIARVHGSDPKSIVDIGKGDRQTYLQIGEYSFDCVKFALLNYKNRVYEGVTAITHGYIESVAFQGGKFDGQTINFSPSLNSLIGVRGSGKSSILEAVRYVFDLPLYVDEKYKKGLVESILGSGGKVTLAIVDKHGKRYTASRILGERPTVLMGSDSDLNITPMSLFDNMQYFGQKDLSYSADHEYGLLEKLVKGRFSSNKSNIEDTVATLIKNIKLLLKLETIPAQIEDCKGKIAEASHKMTIYQERGIAEKLQKQTDVETDKVKLATAKERVNGQLAVLTEDCKKALTNLEQLSNYASRYNQDIIDQAATVLNEIDSSLKQIMTILILCAEKMSDYDKIGQVLLDRIKSLADEFAEIKREFNDPTLNPDTYVELSTSLGELEEKCHKLEEQSKSKSAIENVIAQAIRTRNELLLNEFNFYKNEVQRINHGQNDLKIEIVFKGDRVTFKEEMKQFFKGTSITDTKYQAMCTEFSDFTALMEDYILHRGEKLHAILTASEYAKIVQKLETSYPDLIQHQVKNRVDIYYHGKLLQQHSIGQRASALILFILTQSDNDVILIDQPEDDLDNKIIYDEIIRAILSTKHHSQFIFATHNANIPVLGDAEKVLAMEYQDKTIIVNSGNIDQADTHKQIVDIMEGGREAFDRRQLIYASWRRK